MTPPPPPPPPSPAAPPPATSDGWVWLKYWLGRVTEGNYTTS